MKDILYNKFDVRRFNEEVNESTTDVSKYLLHQSIPTKLENCSVVNFLAELTGALKIFLLCDEK